MTYTSHPAQLRSCWSIYGLLILLLHSACTHATTFQYCSPDVANGWAYNNCKGYVFAILSGSSCWCSNYAPADTVSTSQCDSPCPGWPSDSCGNLNPVLWGYINIGGTPSGTISGSTTLASAIQSSSAAISISPLSFSGISVADPSSSSSSNPGPVPIPPVSTSSQPTQVYTSIISVTGKISTITVTPTAAQTSDSALGAGNGVTAHSGGGLSGGTVAGIVVGVAIAIGLIIGFIVFFWLRKRHRRNLDAVSEGASFKSSSHASKNVVGGMPSRQVSQLSSAGLLTKPARTATGGLSPGDDNRSAGGTYLSSDRSSTHMTVDQRLNPWAIYSNEDSRVSNVSLQDNQDYSRQLRVANPDSKDA